MDLATPRRENSRENVGNVVTISNAQNQGVGTVLLGQRGFVSGLLVEAAGFQNGSRKHIKTRGLRRVRFSNWSSLKNSFESLFLDWNCQTA